MRIYLLNNNLKLNKLFVNIIENPDDLFVNRQASLNDDFTLDILQLLLINATCTRFLFSL